MREPNGSRCRRRVKASLGKSRRLSPPFSSPVAAQPPFSRSHGALMRRNRRVQLSLCLLVELGIASGGPCSKARLVGEGRLRRLHEVSDALGRSVDRAGGRGKGQEEEGGGCRHPVGRHREKGREFGERILLPDSDAPRGSEHKKRNLSLSLLSLPFQNMFRHAARRLAAASAAASSSSSSLARAALLSTTEAVDARALSAVATTSTRSSSMASCRRGFASESDGTRVIWRAVECLSPLSRRTIAFALPA